MSICAICGYVFISLIRMLMIMPDASCPSGTPSDAYGATFLPEEDNDV